MPSSQTPPETVTRRCLRCGREFATHEVALYGFRFDASRFCLVCREAERAESEQRQADVLFEQASIPSGYRECSLSNFELRPGTRTAHRVATLWSADFRRGRTPRRGLLFVGPVGSGKTHLCAAILREAIFSRFARCLFLNVPEWLNNLREIIARDDVEEIPSPRGFEIVVLDDIGAEQSTPWSRDQIYSVLNYREANGRLTLATSNFSFAELGERLGRAAASRLDALCQVVELDAAADYRQRTRVLEGDAA